MHAMDTLGYVRVSTEQQATEDRTSLAEQERAITERALQLGRVLTPEGIFRDPGASGATAEGRPGFMAMLAYCEAHPRTKHAPGLILVLNDSRFGRFKEPTETFHWQYVLRKLGWVVRFAEGDDIPDGVGRDVLRLVGSAQASEYRANLRRTAKRASRAVATEGRWNCEAPLGYRRLATRRDGAQRVLEIGQRKADDEIVRLTLGPDDEQAIVRRVFEGYATGEHSLYTLTLELQRAAPVRTWSTRSVRMILTNPTYTGDIVHGRRPMDEDGTQRVARDPSTWTVTRDTHPSIIAHELYDAVQRRLAQHKRLTRAVHSPYVLTGLLRCACGMTYQGGGGASGPAHDPGRWLFYRCRGADRTIGTCTPPLVTLNKRWVESLVIDRVAAIATEPATFAAIRDELAALIERERTGSPSRRAALDSERDRLIAQRARLVDAIAHGTVDEHEVATSMSEIRARLAAIDLERSRASSATAAHAKLTREMDALIARAAEFRAVAQHATPQSLRSLLAPWIHTLLVHRQQRTLTIALNRVPQTSTTLMDFNSQRPLAAQDATSVTEFDGLIVSETVWIPRRGQVVGGVA